MQKEQENLHCLYAFAQHNCSSTKLHYFHLDSLEILIGSAAVEPSEIAQNSLQATIEMSFSLRQKQETLIGHRVSASKQCVLIFEELPIRDMWQDPQFTQGQEIACSTRLKVELCCRRASWNWSWNSSRWSEMHFSQCMWQFEIFCAYFQHAAHTCCTQAATPALTHTHTYRRTFIVQRADWRNEVRDKAARLWAFCNARDSRASSCSRSVKSIGSLLLAYLAFTSVSDPRRHVAPWQP